MWERLQFGGLRKKADKLRRDPEMFIYDLLRKRIIARPQLSEEKRTRGIALPTTTPSTCQTLSDDLARFQNDLEHQQPHSLVFIFSGTTYIQGVRANRPIRLAKLFRELGCAVVFSFFRWRSDDHAPSYAGDLLFQTPIDFTMTHLGDICALGSTVRRRLFVVGFPFPPLMATLDRFNASGWSSLYDCRDDWELFEQTGQATWYTPEAEAFAVSNCDMTCCVSQPLRDKIQSLVPEARVELSPNALDESFLSDGYKHTPSPEPVVGYFGHLTEAWFDWPGLIAIARHRPHLQFEMIGHSEPDELLLPNNVTLLGPKNHAEICAIACRWKAALIPFKIGPLADAVDPIKIYEYLALGLPTVSFRMPQIELYPYTTTVLTVPAFVRALDQAIATHCDPAVIETFLRANTWRLRAEQILAWSDETRDAPFKKLLRQPTNSLPTNFVQP